MTAFEAYRLYLAMRLHFTNKKYDIVQKQGAVKASEASFMQKKERFTFAKIAGRYKKPQFMSLLAANFAKGDKFGGVYHLAQAEENYKEWLGRTESLTYRYKQDLLYLEGECKSRGPEAFWAQRDEGYPLLIQAYLGKRVMLETLVILNKLYKFVDVMQVDDPILEEVVTLVKKYSPFIRVPKEHFTTITKTTLGV